MPPHGSDLNLSAESVWAYVKQELKPYPGRNWLIVRMTLAAVLMMLWVMVFRIPNAALGVYYTLLISRETTDDTFERAIGLIGAIGAALGIVLLGILLFTGSPLMHFLWVGACLLLTFFLISAASQYRIATGFGFLMTSAIPLWDLPANIDRQLSLTLYSALAIVVAAAITVTIEVVFAAFHKSTPLEDGLAARLQAVSDVLKNAADPPSEASATVRQFSETGTGLLRRNLSRMQSGSESYARNATLIGLTGRLIDLSAALIVTPERPTRREQLELAAIAQQIDHLRKENYGNASPPLPEEHVPGSNPLGLIPLLATTVDLLNRTIEQLDLENEYISAEKPPSAPILRRDAFTNPEHIHFALRGAGAAMVCYILYQILGWKGLSSSLATCMITALSNAGSSRQKQLLRFVGAIAGGLLLGIGSQSVLLPTFDSITSFTVLFTLVTAFSSWIATSSPRISYLGLQVAFAFYLVQLRTFGPAVVLVPARDNVDGIILGLFAMWIVFDQGQSGTAADTMKATFLRSIRLVSSYMQLRPTGSKSEYLKFARGQRDLINETLSQVRTLADAVLFEFDDGRREALDWRSSLHVWQPELRTFFLMQISLTHIRLNSVDGHLSPVAEEIQTANAAALDQIGDLIGDLIDPSLKEKGKIDLQRIQKAIRLDQSRDAPIAAQSGKLLENLASQIQETLARRNVP